MARRLFSKTTLIHQHVWRPSAYVRVVGRRTLSQRSLSSCAELWRSPPFGAVSAWQSSGRLAKGKGKAKGKGGGKKGKKKEDDGPVGEEAELALDEVIETTRDDMAHKVERLTQELTKLRGSGASASA